VTQEKKPRLCALIAGSRWATSRLGLCFLCHHFLVWCAAEDVYPSGRRFLDYALLGDDIVIGDLKGYLRNKQWLADLGVSVSMPKSLVSDIGALEFAKKFRVC
jgi:hypothetical protein